MLILVLKLDLTVLADRMQFILTLVPYVRLYRLSIVLFFITASLVYAIFCRLAINLLRSLCADVNVREQVKVFDGIPALLR